MKLTRLHFSAATLAAMTTLSLFGCGGGGTPSGGSGNFALLVGSGDAAALTTRTWKDISIKPNGAYYVSSAEVPCPAEVKRKDGSDVISCDPTELIQYRSDGKIGFASGTGNFTFSTTESFSVAGSDVTLNIPSNVPTDVVRTVLRIVSTEVVSGKQRVRLRVISSTLGNGASDPTDIGSEVVIEEVNLL